MKHDYAWLAPAELRRRMRRATSWLVLLLAGWFGSSQAQTSGKSIDSLRYTGEVHLRNLRQLTFGGNNAEAYWSFDDKQLIFQSDWTKINPQGCDQIFVMNVNGKPLKSGKQYELLSTGKGRTTCSYFFKDGRWLYASTHGGSPDCPQGMMFSGGRYVWALLQDYEIYVASSQDPSPKLLIGGPGYDAEATISPNGHYIVYTSVRSGDLELWRFDLKTGEDLQLTSELGYDGGAFFSRESKQIVWRASRPTGEEATAYRELLAQGLVEPKALNVFIADANGKNVRQVTNLPGANWAPFFHPDGKRVLFCSNHHSLDKGGRNFDVFMIKVDGTGLERVTHTDTFDAFPMFSYSGKQIVFCSNRNAQRTPTRDTNVFVADWVEKPTRADSSFVSWK